jgi:PD-(D/E)XK nuclease family transposase
MQKSRKLIRFDWAIKRILRDKANFEVLEGFLTTLLSEKVTIKSILGSQSNKEASNDYHNILDVHVENFQGELIMVEILNVKEHDYFHHIVYGTAQMISQYLKADNLFSRIKKVISITIAYFDLGQGLDYVYHGTDFFKGFHHNDLFDQSVRQRELYKLLFSHQIYPEYWIIKAGIFDEEQVHDELDQWIYFFKMGEVQDDFTAAGLMEAKRILDRINLPEAEREEYEAYIQRLHRIASRETNEMEDIKYAVKKAEEKGAAALAKAEKAIRKIQKEKETAQKEKETAQKEKETAQKEKETAQKEKETAEQALQQQFAFSVLAMHAHGLSTAIIAQSLNLTEQHVREMIEKGAS